MNSTLRSKCSIAYISIAIASMLSCGRGSNQDATLAPEANPFSPPSASSNVVPEEEISPFIIRRRESGCGMQAVHLLDDATMNSIIRKVFEDQGITLESEFVIDEPELSVTLDGYDPDARIGYVIAGTRAAHDAIKFPDSTLYLPEYAISAIHEAQLRALGSSSAEFRAPIESLISKFPDETSLRNHVATLPNGADRWRKSRRTAILEVISEYQNTFPIFGNCIDGTDIPQDYEEETSEEQLLATLESYRKTLIECEKPLLGKADMLELERRARDGITFVGVVSMLDPRWCCFQDPTDTIKAENALKQATLDFITWARSKRITGQ